MILAAARLSDERRLSFWDALIVRSAVEGGASVLYSEDMQDGQSFDSLTVHNPFA